MRSKPRIYLYRGFWRVTPWNKKQADLPMWRRAHDFVARLNNKRTVPNASV